MSLLCAPVWSILCFYASLALRWHFQHICSARWLKWHLIYLPHFCGLAFSPLTVFLCNVTKRMTADITPYRLSLVFKLWMWQWWGVSNSCRKPTLPWITEDVIWLDQRWWINVVPLHLSTPSWTFNSLEQTIYTVNSTQSRADCNIYWQNLLICLPERVVSGFIFFVPRLTSSRSREAWKYSSYWNILLLHLKVIILPPAKQQDSSSLCTRP